ncbi:MAG: hypothetical protein AB7T14_09865, partial [Candidatus Methylacidiphilaceae bacterium]
LAQAGGAYSTIQWLVREGDSSCYLSEPLFAKILRAELLERPERITQALRGGDAGFALALERAFWAIGVPEKEARAEVEALAQGQEARYLPAAAANPRSAAAMFSWWTAADPVKSRAERAILVGSPPGRLLEAAAAAAGATLPTPDAPIQAKWETAVRIAEKSGSYARVLGGYAPKEEWTPAWELVLAKLREDVTLDPAHGAEMRRRLAAWDGSWRAARDVLADALAGEGGMEWAGVYFAPGAGGKLWGRPRWLWELIAPGRTPVAAEVLRAGEAVDARLRAGDARLADWLLWDLGRPAESASMAAREALARSLGEDPDAAAGALRGVWQSGASWEEKWLESPWWHADPGVSATTPGELRRKLAAGALSREDLLAFGQALGRYLKASDEAWSGLIEADAELLRRLLSGAYAREPGYAGAWARELAYNDPGLLESFALTAQATVRREEIWPWIKHAAAELAQVEASGGTPPAESAGESFRSQFGTWAFGPGWSDVLGRLRSETRRAAVLRKLIAKRWMAHPEKFLGLYGQLRVLPVASNLAERSAEQLSGSDAPGTVLAALEAWDVPVAAALVPVWTRFLSDESIRKELFGSLAEAGPRSPLQGLAVPAVEQLQALGARLPSGATDPAEGYTVRKGLLQTAEQTGTGGDLWRAIVAVAAYGDGWQPLAVWTLEAPDRVEAFRKALRDAMLADPALSGAIASVARAPGNPEISRRLDRILEDLVNVTLSDRAVWEGLVSDHTGGIRAIVEKTEAAD